MRFFKKDETASPLDEVIAQTLLELETLSKYDEDYPDLLAQLERLYKLKGGEEKRRLTVSGDTLVLAGANILGILLIVGYERANVMRSSAMSQVPKLKIGE